MIKGSLKYLITVLCISIGYSSAGFVSLIDTKTSGGIVIEDQTAEVGSIIMWGNTNPPENWLILDGGKTTGYPQLASIYGENLPDMRGRFVRGLGGSSSALGEVQLDEFKSHNHSATFTGNALPPHSHTINTWDGSKEEYGNAGSMAKNSRVTRTTSSVSAGTPTGSVSVTNYGGSETRPENVALVYIIKAQ